MYSWFTGEDEEAVTNVVSGPGESEGGSSAASRARRPMVVPQPASGSRQPPKKQLKRADPFLEPASARESRERVLVRVYDLGTTFLTHPHNALSRSYGAFHTGVEVYGREWSFGMSDDWRTGVTWCPPGKNPDHTFRETLAMGFTKVSFKDFAEMLNLMKQEWMGGTYNLLTRNCHHFSDALCRRLGVGCLPTWVNDLAGVGDATASAFDKVYSSISITDAFYTVKSGLYLTIAGVPECFSGRRRPNGSNEVPPHPQLDDSDEEDHANAFLLPDGGLALGGSRTALQPRHSFGSPRQHQQQFPAPVEGYHDEDYPQDHALALVGSTTALQPRHSFGRPSRPQLPAPEEGYHEARLPY